MTAEEVEASGLRRKMNALQGNCYSASADVLAVISAVIAPALRSLDFERQHTRRKQVLVEGIKVASCKWRSVVRSA